MWNWQQPDWPHFSFDENALREFEQRFLLEMGNIHGTIKHIKEQDRVDLKIDLLGDEAFTTSKIEGELLDRNSLQASLKVHFGLEPASIKIPLAEQGITDIMMQLWKNFDQPISNFELCGWHDRLMRNRRDLDQVGTYRIDQAPMQIVSGPVDKLKIHFSAPPSSSVPEEMDHFVNWFNKTGPKGSAPLSPLIRAGIAHLYFISIHPFEDGNGRIGRALSEKALAQTIGQPTLVALAHTIERNRKAYYEAIANSNHTNQVTRWLTYFSETIIQAQATTIKRIEFIITKARFFEHFQDSLNQRQTKALLRVFKEGIDGFKGGLSAENYMAITGATRPTTTRDLKALADIGALVKTGYLKSTRYYLNLNPFSN